MTPEQHKKFVEKLFEKKSELMSRQQVIAENFYPERADFTTPRNLGEEFGIDLYSSYPILCRRDLADSIGSLMPIEEFEITTNNEEDLDQEGRQWLERSTKIQKRAMLDRVAQLDRAKKEGDNDYAAFGQCVISCEYVRPNVALLHRNWHLRDMVWCTNAYGEVDYKARRDNWFAKDVVDYFPETVSKAVRELAAKDPFAEVKLYHIVCASRYCEKDADYEVKGQGERFKWVSLYMEAKECYQLEKVYQHNGHYAIPRWHTLSQSQYAYSPASIVALPDARLIQDMTRVLLTAGEKAVDPPMLAFSEAIRSDVNMHAGGMTWAEKMSDDRFGDPIKLMANDKSGLPIGLEMQQDTRAMIREAFYLNKLTMPQPSKQMTAYEVGQRVSEWVRQSLPLFRPVETDYNGAICEMDFELLLHAGAFGPPEDMPASLSDADVRFKFKTPLREADGAKKANALMRSRELLDTVADIDRGAVHVVDFRGAYRSAVEGVEIEQRFIRGEEEVKRLADADAQQQAADAELQRVATAAPAVKDLAAAEASMGKAA